MAIGPGGGVEPKGSRCRPDSHLEDIAVQTDRHSAPSMVGVLHSHEPRVDVVEKRQCDHGEFINNQNCNLEELEDVVVANVLVAAVLSLANAAVE